MEHNDELKEGLKPGSELAHEAVMDEPRDPEISAGEREHQVRCEMIERSIKAMNRCTPVRQRRELALAFLDYLRNQVRVVTLRIMTDEEADQFIEHALLRMLEHEDSPREFGLE